MVNHNGWIKIWRKAMKNELYNDGPFDKFHAWMDLLLLANPSDGKLGKPGRIKTTLEALRIRWSWGSKWKVTEFLQTLHRTFMIDYKTMPGKGGGVLIDIKNYMVFQANKKGKKTTKKDGSPNEKPNERRHTSTLSLKEREREGDFFESSLERDSKNPSQEEKSGGVGKAMTPDQLMEWLAQGEEDK